MGNFLDNLQNKPYATRVKILWSTTAVVGLVILAVWAFDLKSSIRNTPGTPLINNQSGVNGSQTESQFITVEGVENTAGILKIYFNLNNQTDDILNVPALENITLTTNGESTSPQAIQNRQGQGFDKKILSHTQIFGILNFPATAAESGTLTFNQMFLEKSPEKLLTQSLELDFNKLKLDPNLRN